MAPIGYMWTLSGGGITRAPALGFAFLALRFLVAELRSPSKLRLTAATGCCALTVLYHPEITQLLAASCAVVALIYVRSSGALLLTACVGVGTLVLATPWLVLVGSRYGFGLIFDAGQGTAVSSLMSDGIDVRSIVRSPVKILSFVPLLSVSLGLAVYRRHTGLALLITACLFTRNVPHYGWPGLALTLGALSDAALRMDLRILRVPAVMLAVVAVLGGVALSFQPLPIVPAGERDAMAWIRDNTSSRATFLVFPPYQDWYGADPTGEWFAALSGRTAYGPPFGAEWVGQFYEEADAYVRLSHCPGRPCIEQWAEAEGLAFDYLYVPRTASVEPEYELVYENGAARVYRSSPPTGQSTGAHLGP
jgi:hypothetical protein